jgi:methionine-rich copper-binding protein CopC
MRNLLRLPVLAAAAALLIAGPASAHAKLVASTPAANATVAAPKVLTLTFNEKVTAAFTKVELAMVDHQMTVPVKFAVAKDGKTLTVTPGSALMKGAYKLTWTTASADGHKMSGDVAFKVG